MTNFIMIEWFRLKSKFFCMCSICSHPRQGITVTLQGTLHGSLQGASNKSITLLLSSADPEGAPATLGKVLGTISSILQKLWNLFI